MKYVRGRFKPNDTRLITHFPHQMHLTETSDQKLITCDRARWKNLTPEVIEWCNETYGQSFREWAYYTGGKILKVYFKTKEDALAFKIMWS